MSVSAPHQVRQPSRKGKQAWRKNIDVSAIQDGLEAAREEELCGGIVSELPSDSLFTLDPSGDAGIQKAYNRHSKPLRSDEILAQRSAIPAVASRKRKDAASSHNVGNGILPAKRRREGGVPRKELERLRGIAYGGDAVKKDVVTTGAAVVQDLWGDDGHAVQKPGLSAEDKFSFLEDPIPVRPPETLKHGPVSLLASGRAMPAVPRPVEGKSYNPSFEAWDALVRREGEAEVAKERRRLQEAASDAELAGRVAKSAEEARRAEEDADESAWESEWEGFVSDREEAEAADTAWAGRKKPERKTKSERNRIERRKEEARLRKHEQKMREKRQQLERAKELATLADDKQKARALALAAALDGSSDDDDAFDTHALRRRRLGKFAIPEAPLELVLADELQDSLRALRPEGSLLGDRFRSMQVRGRIEARRPVSQPKKARRKATEKWSYKDWRLKY